MVTLTPESGPKSPASIERGKLVVSQPSKLKELNMLLESLENLDARVSEQTGEDRSQDLGAAGAGAGAGTGAGSGQSARDRALAHLPSPQAMHKKLSVHVEQEIRHLERLTRSAASSSRPGSAFRLNELYARIRRLNTLLAEMFQASMELIRRLFIRVFVDKQPIL